MRSRDLMNLAVVSICRLKIVMGNVCYYGDVRRSDCENCHLIKWPMLDIHHHDHIQMDVVSLFFLFVAEVSVVENVA